ncbi:MAG: GatB/YqeY domain-containing protein [Pseudomonadota bacterium]
MASDETPLNTTLRERIDAALNEAENRDPDSVRTQTLRLLVCAIRDRDVSARTRGECDGCPEAAVRDVVETMAVQLRLSADEYEEAGRIEEAERERDELAVIESFLPTPLDSEALETAVLSVVEELEASKLKDVGRCMQALKSRFPGQIDPAHAGKLVRNTLMKPAQL